MTLALYGKTRRRRAGLLLAGLMAVVIAIGGGLFLRNNDDASALTLGSANGTWTAHVGSPTGFSGEGTNRIYWGSGDSGQSSYRWQSGPAATFTAGQSFLLGDFTHYNNPIDSSITSATLSLPLAFTDPAITRNLSVIFAHDETPNGADPCAYAGANGQGVNINGCADRVQLPTLGADQHFQIGDNLYTLVFTGFHPIDAGTACPAEDPGVGEVTTFLTREQAENKGCVYAQLTFVAPVVDVAKEAVAATINVGEDAKFKITVTNASEAVATGWSLTDTLPAGFTWSMESGPAACGVSAGVLSCTDMTIQAGTVSVPGKVEIVVKASTDGAACGPIVNPLVTITKGALTETAGPATVTVVNCTRNLRIVKVPDPATHPLAFFNGTLTPFGGTSQPWTIPLGVDEPWHQISLVITDAEYQLAEVSTPNWSNAGYEVKADPGGDTATCGTTYVNPGGSAVVPSGNASYLVCIKNTYTPPTHTIQICKVVEQNNDGVDQSGNFSGEIRQWTAAASFTAVPWSITGVVEGGAAVCTTVSTIPADRTFNVTEFGFRPGTWVSDASGYPWYQDNKGMTHSANVTTVNYTGDVTVTFHNKSTAATRNVEVCKVAVANGDGVSVPAFGYSFDIRQTGTANISGSNTVAEPNPDINDSQTAEVCTTKLVPTDKSFDVVEWTSRPSGWMGDATGYPMYSINGGAPVSNNTTTQFAAGSTDVKVTFYNKELPKTRVIVIAKHFTSLNGYVPGSEDYPVFTFVPAITPAPVCTIDESKLPESVSWSCVVPASWDGSVSEGPVDGWQDATGCPLTVSFAGGPEVFNFCNRPYGTIQIVKNDLTTAANSARPDQWDFTYGSASAGGGSIPLGGGTLNFLNVPLGTYTAAETNGSYSTCSGTGPAGINQYFTTNVQAGPLALTAPGDTITFAFRNEDCGAVLGTGTLEVFKVKDLNGNHVTDGGDTNIAWQVIITGPEFPAGQLFDVPVSGLFLNGILEGVYTVQEIVSGNYNVVGVESNETPFVALGTSIQVTLADGETGDLADIVTFYNQPKLSIRAHKFAYTSLNGGANVPALGDDDGWTITVTSANCGIDQSKQTDSNGDAEFTNLPYCTDYVVSENPVNALSPGFVPSSPVSISGITPTEGTGTFLTFSNVKSTDDRPECIYNCSDIPTPTPTIPTATPTTKPGEPTNTPVPPTATPTKTAIVAGEKTPGPASPTPIVPSTGSGADGSAGVNFVFIIVGLFAITTGMGAMALRSTRRR